MDNVRCARDGKLGPCKLQLCDIDIMRTVLEVWKKITGMMLHHPQRFED